MPGKRRKGRRGGGRGKESEGSGASSSADLSGYTENPRTCTAILTSERASMDLHWDSVTLSLHGRELITDCSLELNYGNRYGLIGVNGSGKASLLRAIGNREFEVPDHISIGLLDSEAEPSDLTPMEYVLADVEKETKKIDEEINRIMEEEGPESETLLVLYDRLEELDMSVCEARAGTILFGLGFDKFMQQEKPLKDYSGGWRMRIALAKNLFTAPILNILIQPSNHLDQEAVVWLEEYLSKYKHILVIVSHSQDFLDGVCTNIIHLHNKKLIPYGGNYSSFVRTRSEQEENQMKRYEKEQADIQDMKDYVARFGHGTAKLAKQGKSKEKLLNKMLEAGLTEKVVRDKAINVKFPDPGTLNGPIVQVHDLAFGYPNADLLYANVNLSVDLNSRVCIVGNNGTGKSTLLKLIVGDLEPTDGMIKLHSHLRFGRFHQHLTEQLDPEMNALDHMLQKFPNELNKTNVRSAVGRYGLSGDHQLMPIKQLSDGLKSRLVFAELAMTAPHILVLDEPTNFLDMETIDALADGINEFKGGLLMVSHDFRLISQVADTLWVTADNKVTIYDGDIGEYKETLRQAILADENKWSNE